jgi:hypothetical protein
VVWIGFNWLKGSSARSQAIYNLCIVEYLLKAKTLEPEKQPLLANGLETTFVSRQRLGKHVPAATDMHATIEVLLEMVLSTRSVQRSYKEDTWGNRVSDPCGGGIKYLHRSPASRKRRRKGNPVPGGITGPPCSSGM